MTLKFRYFFVRKVMFVKYAVRLHRPARRLRDARRVLRGADPDPDGKDPEFPVVLMGSKYGKG